MSVSPSPTPVLPAGSAPVAAPVGARPGPCPAADRKVRGAVAGVAAAMLVSVATLLLAVQWLQPREEPWRSADLTRAKARLVAEPRNEELKQQIRALDLELRRGYFRSLERNRTGAWLLLGAAVAVVLLGRQLFPAGSPAAIAAAAPARDVLFRRTSWTVLGVGLGAGVIWAGLGLATRSHLPEALAALTSPDTAASAEGGPVAAPGRESEASPAPSATTVQEAAPPSEAWMSSWPQFRGPEGANRAATADLPLTWDTATGQGVLWRTNLPLPGFNSPVVWGDRVFLAGGDRKARRVYCIDVANGALHWERAVAPPDLAGQAVEPPDQSGAAASTVATDGTRVFAVFASGELGALDFNGALLWHHRLDFSENGYGHASSLAVAGGRVLVQADQGQAEEGKSRLIAYEAASGKVAWEAKRPVGGSWTSPLILGSGVKARVITSGDPWLMAHDLQTGAEVWRARVLGGELAPSPVAAGEFIVAASPGHALTAVRMDGQGDVTATHVAWKLEQDVPDVPTPVVAGTLLFTASTEGHLFCRETATGAKVWEHAFETEFQATPLLAGDRLYLFSQPGGVFVVQAGREFRQLAAFEMGEEIYASPAVAGGRLFVRTKSALFAIGGSTGPSQVAHVR